MQNYRWFNMSHPQTLQSAQLLLYLNGAFSLVYLLAGATSLLVGILAVPAAFGIANDKRIGWYGGIAVAVLLTLSNFLFVPGFSMLLSLMFNILLLVLLLHPMSRDYQKIWFK